ncbi:MAG TPA: prepilin-type N-terminal cleavage/methylation domain-containing protein [Candidatus Bathyarchaeia archaeon]|nr:prepilin-type N-terminal cleavage/methylation domain-containing protein [Candidatus Bathyarchaeia archaeon]
MRRQHGFSLVELLVVIAIVSILAMMQVQAGIKALRQARAVATGEAMRQNRIGHMADNANRGRLTDDTAATREACRNTFRQMYETGKAEAAVTEVLYALHNDQDFDAYYHTLVDPEADDELVFQDGKLKARTGDGTEVLLEPLSDRIIGVATMWEFLSTDMSNMTADTNIRVMYNDGHVDSVHYPSRFPASRIVAELGQDYMEKTT